jgi:hypothetical protein
MNRLFAFLTAAAVSASASVSPAATVVIEGFETEDLADWRATSSPSTQVLNSTNPTTANTPIFQSANGVTQGTKAGDFITTWTVSSPASGTNITNPADGATFWQIRYNINAPGNLPAIQSADGILEANFTNPNAYPISVALVVDDSSGAQLERGPLLTVPANGTLAYIWNFATTPPAGWATHSANPSTFNDPTVRLKTMLVYTATQPTSDQFHLYVDNIRNTNAQGDTTPPAIVKVTSAVQGPAPGQMTVNWVPNTEPDLVAYKVYVGSDANFGAPTYNRLSLPSATLAATVPAPASSATVTVPTDANVYVRVTAVDNATPVPNETPVNYAALGVRLRPNGAAVQDRIVLDLDRNAPGTTPYSDEGYNHAIVYNGRALADLGRYYDSAFSTAVDTGAVTLAPNPQGMVIWSNMLDGTSTSSVAMTTQSVAALTTFYNADGNLLISGAGLAEDLAYRGPSQQTFLANILKATLALPSALTGNVTPLSLFSSAGALFVNGSVFTRQVGFGTTSSDVVNPTGGALPIAQYTDVVPTSTGYAGVANANRVVYLAFGFESITDPAATNAETTQSAPKRQAVMAAAVDYLLNNVTPSTAAKDWTLFE